VRERDQENKIKERIITLLLQFDLQKLLSCFDLIQDKALWYMEHYSGLEN
jgi:hypothetical protein